MGEEEGMKEGKREKEETAEREKEEKKRRLSSATPKKKTEKVKTPLRSQAELVPTEVGKGEEERDSSLPSTPVLHQNPLHQHISFTNSTSNEAASLPGGEPWKPEWLTVVVCNGQWGMGGVGVS